MNKKILTTIVSMILLGQSTIATSSTLPMENAPTIDFSTKKITPASESTANKAIVEAEIKAMKNETNAIASDCADPTQEDTLAKAQSDAIKKSIEATTTPINMGNIFDVGKKKGCFSVLTNFPDLSVTIPTITGMFTQVKDLLLKYATRKVCNAVDDAFGEMIEPLNNALNEVTNRGQLDLTGAVNKELSKQMNQIDSEIGKVKNKDQTEYELKW